MLYRDHNVVTFLANWYVACSLNTSKGYNYYHALGVYPTIPDAKRKFNGTHIRYVTGLEYMKLSEKP
jgi:hypothetical protein